MKVLIVYEVEVRELDSALLLKIALEMRGHEVKLIDKFTLFNWRYKDCIIVVPNSYHTQDYKNYNYRLNAKNNHILNLQYEQVFSKNTEKNGYMIPKGEAKKEHFICWGPYTYNQLIDNGLSSSQLSISGALHLDFVRTEFSSFWKSKQEISREYNIPLDKEWLLYISSFSYVNNNKYIRNAINEIGVGDANPILEMEEVSNKSHKLTLNWFEKLIEENEDFVMIYRPHPMEASHVRLKEIREKYPNNFFVISDYNIKQWITISDQIITWFSTSISESYFSKRMCHILRPIPIPEDLDPRIYEETTDVIDTYEELKNVVTTFNHKNDFKIEDFPISKQNISKFYYWDEKEATFQKIVNVIEYLGTLKKQPVEKRYFINRWKFLLKNNVLRRLIFIKTYRFIYDKFKFTINNEKFRLRYSLDKLEHDVLTRDTFKKNILLKESKLREILQNNYNQMFN